MASNKNDITTPDLPTLQTSLSRLVTAAHILDGFAHRNKNQHRGTRWWGPFSMLRANLHKVLPDLEGAVQRAEVLSTSTLGGTAAKRRKTEGGGGGHVGVKRPELDRVVQRAQWVHDVVGAKAYEAFTQVAADRQFAQLGLALIGVLAQVEAAIVPFVEAEADSDPGDAPDQIRVGLAVGAKGDASLALEVLDPSPSQGDDLGVAISREELVDDDVELKDEKSLPPPAAAPSSRKEERSSILKPEKSKSDGNLSRKGKDTESQRTVR
ncbi:Ribonuclease MRP protein subunit RMP1 [Cytospora mali]|uniref:Ribonuclease MRP protein subunit RMP1 n=1 Tax=Cytospora mali TaxID=578113 RepID=A0A194VM63_CYTMA|nr:Ribonuclease MRP protein subunit RMP1 [Valsa mali]